MKDQFNVITDAFHAAGIDSKKVEFSITEYSLNSKLSFKFNNIKELMLFLDITPVSEKGKAVKAMFVEAGIDPDKFFYVNFFKPKVAEL
ncbi:MAG: hypothetical protein DI539_11950 [Flavobacterium psychrophilum]|nr:MAG: hypothetical protein DI539_11950 [Flavobacterium psychrophilum]